MGEPATGTRRHWHAARFLDASGQVNIADVFLYKGIIGHSCTNP